MFPVTPSNLQIQLPDMKSVYRQSAKSLRVCIRACARARVCILNGRKRQNKVVSCDTL